MDLEKRVFAKYYPSQLNDKYYSSRSHGVSVTDFRLMPNFYYDFGIQSPSTHGGERRYELSFMRQAPTKDQLPENYFRGLLGESVMRIITMEFLRQQQKKLGIQSFKMVKIQPDKIYRKSEEFSLEHISRYTTNLYKFDGHRKLVGEYDGMIEYTTIDQKKGMLIMESKTGVQGIFKNPEHSKEGILDRYCDSVKSLFPDHEVDFLFMSTTDNILNRPHGKRQIRPNLCDLKDILREHDVGLLLFEYPIDKNKLDVMGKKMAKYHTLRNEDVPLDTGSRFVVNGSFMWLIEDKNIVKILEREENNHWHEIYSI